MITRGKASTQTEQGEATGNETEGGGSGSQVQQNGTTDVGEALGNSNPEGNQGSTGEGAVSEGGDGSEQGREGSEKENGFINMRK